MFLRERFSTLASLCQRPSPPTRVPQLSAPGSDYHHKLGQNTGEVGPAFESHPWHFPAMSEDPSGDLASDSQPEAAESRHSSRHVVIAMDNVCSSYHQHGKRRASGASTNVDTDCGAATVWPLLVFPPEQLPLASVPRAPSDPCHPVKFTNLTRSLLPPQGMMFWDS